MLKVYFSIVLLISDPDRERKLLLKVRDRVAADQLMQVLNIINAI